MMLYLLNFLGYATGFGNLINIMPKIKVFLWQRWHNALPLKGTRLRMGVTVDANHPICPSYQVDIKSTDHIFMEWLLSNKVWDLAIPHNWLPSVPFDSSFTSLRSTFHCLYL